MTRKLVPTFQGNDYQIRWFWIQVCRLFASKSKVIRVEYEANNITSFDDVVVHYEGLIDQNGVEKLSDCYQLKFHVSSAGAVTWESLMDPAFINATSVSILQRAKNAQQKFAPNGVESEFILLTPWQIDPKDLLAEAHSNADGRLNWDTLKLGGLRSKFGKLRSAWRQHLGVDSDDVLERIILPLRIRQGRTLIEFGEELNRSLVAVGLKPVEEGALVNPYDDLAKKLLQSSTCVSLTREEAERILKQEGLWIGSNRQDENRKQLGIRSFVRWSEHLEDTTDELLDLSKYFDGRSIRKNLSWSEDIVQRVKAFLSRNAKPGSSIDLEMHSHLSIAFTAGYCLPSKAGVDSCFIQSARERWASWKSAESTSHGNCSTRTEEGQEKNKLNVALSITHDVSQEVRNFVAASGELPTLVFIEPTNGKGATTVQDGAHAWLLAEEIVAALRALTVQYNVDEIRLFAAAPAGLLFFIGQLAHVLGEIALFEYDFGVATGKCELSVKLPSMLNAVAVAQEV